MAEKYLEFIAKHREAQYISWDSNKSSTNLSAFICG
jgi:hypothetical protein